MFSQFKAKRRHQRLQKQGIYANPTLASHISFYGERTGAWPLYNANGLTNGQIYTFGVGNNLSWEIDVINAHQVNIFAYDPTPASVQWVANQTLPSKLMFEAIGLADFCGTLDFFIPRREGRYNYSVVRRGGKYPNQSITCDVADLNTICSHRGHTNIDVLKLDIEGAEMAALPNALASNVHFNQLLVELHYNYSGVSFDNTISIINEIKKHGYECYWVSDRAYEFGFVHRDAIIT